MYVCIYVRPNRNTNVTKVKDETIAPINGFYKMCRILLHILIQKKTNLMQIRNLVTR